MDIKGTEGQNVPSPEETEVQPELLTVEQLPAALGFIETEEMTDIKRQLTDARLSGDAVEASKLEVLYYTKGEGVAFNAPDHQRGGVGLIIAMGLVRRDSGNYLAYLSDLRDALHMADMFDYEDIGPSLGPIVRAVRDEYEPANPEKEPTVDDLTEIWKGLDSDLDPADLEGMDYLEILSNLASLIEEKGLDPIEYLRQKGFIIDL